MKTKLMIAALALVGLFSSQVQAQVGDEAARIKILPSKDGILKVHYALEINEPVTVKFFDRDRILATDVISGVNYEKGLMKRYNVKHINSKDFWVEVSSSKVTVTHRVVPSKDKKSFASYLEKTTYNYPVVASNN
jgi:hypothetical protein